MDIHLTGSRRLPIIGFVLGGWPDGRLLLTTRIIAAFREGLQRYGYAEGENIVIEWRFAEGDSRRFRDFAEELISLGVDVIVLGNSAASSTFKAATQTIPIVLAIGVDLVAAGSVESVKHPGGNITGLSTYATGVYERRIEYLQEAIPGISRVGFLWEPRNAASETEWVDTRRAAHALGIRLESAPVMDVTGLEAAFDKVIRLKAQAIMVLPSSLLNLNERRIVDLADQCNLHLFGGTREIVEAGGLLSYGADRYAMVRRAAAYVHKLLNGASPATMPVEQATRFELVCNPAAAASRGLTLSPHILAEATYIVPEG
jgi:putative tryptophan/tyrosine transport system substrate-binding protein